jgi:hypothetical protein
MYNDLTIFLKNSRLKLKAYLHDKGKLYLNNTTQLDWVYLRKDIGDGKDVSKNVLISYNEDNKETYERIYNPFQAIRIHLATNLLCQFNLYLQLISLKSFQNKYKECHWVFHSIILSLSLIIKREIDINLDHNKEHPAGFTPRQIIYPEGRLNYLLKNAQEELKKLFEKSMGKNTLEKNSLNIYNPIPMLKKIEECCKLIPTNSHRPIDFENRKSSNKTKTLSHDIVATTSFIIGKLIATAATTTKEKDERKDIIHQMSLLCFAARYNLTEAVKTMLALGTDINQVDKNDQTPLLYAIRFQRISIVKQLIEHQELDIMKVDKAGYNAMFYAVQVANLEFLKLLISRYKGDPNKLFYCGEKPYPILQHALFILQKESKSREIINYLLASKFEVSYGAVHAPCIIRSYDRSGVTAFLCSIRKEFAVPDFVDTLLGMRCMDPLILEWEWRHRNLPYMKRELSSRFRGLLYLRIEIESLLSKSYSTGSTLQILEELKAAKEKITSSLPAWTRLKDECKVRIHSLEMKLDQLNDSSSDSSASTFTQGIELQPI